MSLFSKKAKKESKADAEKQAEAPKQVAKKVVKPKAKRKAASGDGAQLTKTPGRILKSPRITEKAAYMTVQGAYVFEVAQDATKRDVIAAVHALYKVTPRKVNMVRKKPRAYVARFRNRRGMKVGMKKAYVFLKKGDKIDIV